MFAILPLSSCVKALGVLDARRSGRFGDSESDANCTDGQPLGVLRGSSGTYFDVARFALAVKVVVFRLIFSQDAVTKIIKCGLLAAFKHRPGETKYIRGHLTNVSDGDLRDTTICSPASVLTLRCREAALQFR